MHLVVLTGAAEREHVLAIVSGRIVVDRVHVAAEDALIRIHGVIDTRQRLVFCVVGRNAVLQTSARIARDWNMLEELHRYWAERRRIDRVVDEAGAGRQCARRAARSSHGGEVAGQHRRCRYEADRLGWIALLDPALVSSEEEQLLL